MDETMIMYGIEKDNGFHDSVLEGVSYQEVVELRKSLTKLRSENQFIKEVLEKSDRMLYDLINGLNNMSDHHEASDYYFAVEALLTNNVESWFECNKLKFEAILEEERMNMVRLNALNKLSDEEKRALGLI